jgi:hypothetical protein
MITLTPMEYDYLMRHTVACQYFFIVLHVEWEGREYNFATMRSLN